MKRFLALSFAFAVAGCVTDNVGTAPVIGTTTNVVFSGGTVTATVASTCSARSNGLKNVASLGANAGMLFVFAETHDSLDVAFYMQDTPIPLSIAFIDSNFQVVSVDDMAAETLTQHKSKKPFRYALEVNLGWLAAHSVAAGSTVAFTVPAGTITDPYPCVQ